MTKAGRPAPSDDPHPTYGFGFPDLVPRDAGSDALLLRLADAASADGLGRPARVTAVLDAAYEGPAGTSAFSSDRLSMVDRAAALFALAHRLGRWPASFVARCEACGRPSLLRVSSAEYAYAPARAYEIERSGTRYRQPNGHDEAALAASGTLTAAALRLGPPPPREPPDDEVLEALAEAGPAFATALPFACSACGAPWEFWFDPLAWILRQSREALVQVHRLALAYGWSEAEILALPPARRRAYLQLIEAEA